MSLSSSSSSSKKDIANFQLDRHEQDITTLVPTLKGQSNWREWEASFYLALNAQNTFYVHMIQGHVPQPDQPRLYELTLDAVRASYGENDVPSDDAMEARLEDWRVRNRTRNKEYHEDCEKWHKCNYRARAHLTATVSPDINKSIMRISDVREAYQALQKLYAKPSHQVVYQKFDKIVDMRYKSGSAAEFVRKFQDAFRELVEIGGAIPDVIQLSFFKKAIITNSRCSSFLQNLKIEEKKRGFMDDVYVQFIENESVNRQLNFANNSTTGYSANLTANSTSSSDSESSKSKDRKSKKNDLKNNSKKDSKSKDKKQDKEGKKKEYRDHNDIFYRFHNTMGNHFTNRCPLKTSGASPTSSNAVLQLPANQPVQPVQVAVPNPGQVIGLVNNQGQVVPIQQQKPQQQQPQANAAFATQPTQQQSGDSGFRYNSLFSNAVFTNEVSAEVSTSNAVSISVSKEGELADNGDDPNQWMLGDPVFRYNSLFSNAIFTNENPMPTVLPNPDYELDLLQQKQVVPDNLSIVDRHRSLSPTVEELPDESFTTPSSPPPLRPDSPVIEPVENEPVEDDDMAGSFGRYGEEQREEEGVHFDAGGSLVLVEPQTSSGGSGTQNQPQLRRSTRIRKPSRAYIESLETQRYFDAIDANVLQLLGDFEAAQLESIFTFATSKDSFSMGKKPADEGFIPEDWVQAMTARKRRNGLLLHTVSYIATKSMALGGWLTGRSEADCDGYLLSSMMVHIKPNWDYPNWGAVWIEFTVF
jgi:hypothetical protein